ncbi:LysR substrate-binding domain-containing protein [Vibrio viridaestus]|uniref:LysR substrate-binding domain-containing protein n=1 Tax=Vibrio viridaestus TaxID=2487322 RepID=UPI002441BFB5|nr:LysR substrate-binding domain-containing protein [Vibrio viridaestus]
MLENYDQLISILSLDALIAHGQVNICSSFGFGRAHLAPAVADLSRQYPELDISFEVFDRTIDLVQEGFDLEIFIGNDLPEQHISKRLAKNSRILYASPNYLDRFGTPQHIHDLKQHQCLVIKDRHVTNGAWKLTDRKNKNHFIKIAGSLSSNNGDIVRQWALNGCGIMLRSQ